MKSLKYLIIFRIIILVGACAKRNDTSPTPVINYSLAYAGDCQNCRIEYLDSDNNWVVYDTIGSVALYPPARLSIQSGFEARIKATSNDSTRLYLIALLAIREDGDTAVYKINHIDPGVNYSELSWRAP